MAKIKSETQDIYQVDGLLDSESLTVEHEDGIVDIAEILNRIDGKYVKISITATDTLEVPFKEE